MRDRGHLCLLLVMPTQRDVRAPGAFPCTGVSLARGPQAAAAAHRLLWGMAQHTFGQQDPCRKLRQSGARWLDAKVPVAASFTIISRARFTWVRRAHRPQLFLVLCSHNTRIQLLRKLPGAHLAVCMMAGEGGRGQIRGSISYGACGAARARWGGLPREEASRAIPAGGHPVPALSPSWAGASRGRVLSSADAQGSLAVVGTRAGFGGVGLQQLLLLSGFLWHCWGWGSLECSPGSPIPAVSLPTPDPAADLSVWSEKASFRCLATLCHPVQRWVRGWGDAPWWGGGALPHHGRGAARCWSCARGMQSRRSVSRARGLHHSSWRARSPCVLPAKIAARHELPAGKHNLPPSSMTLLPGRDSPGQQTSKSI